MKASLFQKWLSDEATTLGVPFRVPLSRTANLHAQKLLRAPCVEGVYRALWAFRATIVHLCSWASYSLWRSGDGLGVMQPAVTQPKPLQLPNLAQITRLRALTSLRPIIPK